MVERSIAGTPVKRTFSSQNFSRFLLNSPGDLLYQLETNNFATIPFSHTGNVSMDSLYER